MWVDCVGADKTETKFTLFYPKMIKFMEINFTSAFGPSAAIWADLDADTIRANVSARESV